MLEVGYLVTQNCFQFVLVEQSNYASVTQTLPSPCHLPKAKALGMDNLDMPTLGLGIPAVVASSAHHSLHSGFFFARTHTLLHCPALLS